MSVRPLSIRSASLLALPLLLLVGCSGVTTPPAISNAGPTFADPSVFVAGNSGTAAMLWNVDFALTPVTITPIALSGGTAANGLVEVGSSLYATGTNTTASGSSAVLWQYTLNAASASAPAPLSASTTGDGNAIVASGTTLYIGGDDGGVAQIWTVNTTNDAATDTASTVTGICTDGTTIYAIGNATLAGVVTPMFWSVNLAGASPVITATPYTAGTTFHSITVYQGTVYIAGDNPASTADLAISTGATVTTANIFTVAAPTASVASFEATPVTGFSGAGAVGLQGSNLLVGGWGLQSVVGTTAYAQIGVGDLTQTPLAFNPYGIPAAVWETFGYVSGFAVSNTAIYAAGTTGTWDQVQADPSVGVATVWMNQIGTANAAATLLTDGTVANPVDSHANAVVVPNP
jgi:hypothetical protein